MNPRRDYHDLAGLQDLRPRSSATGTAGMKNRCFPNKLGYSWSVLGTPAEPATTGT